MNTRLAIISLAILAVALVVGTRARATAPAQEVMDVEVRRYIETQLRPYLYSMSKQVSALSRKAGLTPADTAQGNPPPPPGDGHYPGFVPRVIR